MLAFKIMDDPHVGTITFCRVYSGKVESGANVINSSRDKKERVGRMLADALQQPRRRQGSLHRRHRGSGRPEGNSYRRYAVRPLKDAVILEKMEFPEPVIEIAVEPKSKADQEKLGIALAKLAAEDPSFRVSTDQESGQTILRRDGRTPPGHQGRHSEAVPTRSTPISAQPQVAYREKLTKRTEIDYTHKKQTGGTGQFARVKICGRSRTSRGKGFEFSSKIVGGTVPKEYIPGVEKGLNSVLGAGILAGFPVVDIKVELIDGAYHDVDSSALAFEIASRAALP